MEPTSRPPCTRCGHPSFGIFLGEPRCFPHQNHKKLHTSLGARYKREVYEAYQHDDVGLPHDLDPVARESCWGVKQRAADPYVRLQRGE